MEVLIVLSFSFQIDMPKSEHKPGIFDDLLLMYFRKKMVKVSSILLLAMSY